MDAKAFVDILDSDFYTGVPDSLLKPLFCTKSGSLFWYLIARADDLLMVKSCIRESFT